MKVLFRLLAIALLVLGSGMAACGDDDDGDDDAAPATEDEGAGEEADAEEEPAPEAEEDEAEPQAVQVVAADYEFTEAPTEVQAGVIEVTFENHGSVGHEAQMVSIGDTPVEQFVADFGGVLEGGPFPAYAEEVTGVGEVEPGGTLTARFTVTEGNYVWFCTLGGDAADPEAEGAPHFTRGMVQAVTVVPGGEPALPESDSTITARDYEFDVDVQAGDQVVNFVNEGPEQIHHAILLAFADGTTEEAARAALTSFITSEDESAPPPPEIDLETSDTLGDSAVYSEGQGGTFELSLVSGKTYGVICFLSDREGGPPHVIAHEMMEIFTVE